MRFIYYLYILVWILSTIYVDKLYMIIPVRRNVRIVPRAERTQFMRLIHQTIIKRVELTLLLMWRNRAFVIDSFPYDNISNSFKFIYIYIFFFHTRDILRLYIYLKLDGSFVIIIIIHKIEVCGRINEPFLS